MDSYPEALGQLLVIMLKTENYKNWGPNIQDQIDLGNYIPRRIEKNNEYSYIETEPTEENKKDLKKSKEWEISFFDCSSSKNKYIVLLKWNYKFMIENCQILNPLINIVCPTLDRSIFLYKTQNINDFKDDYEWQYIINLETETFSVFGGKNEVQFDIKNIPYDWIEKINN